MLIVVILCTSQKVTWDAVAVTFPADLHQKKSFYSMFFSQSIHKIIIISICFELFSYIYYLTTKIFDSESSKKNDSDSTEKNDSESNQILATLKL